MAGVTRLAWVSGWSGVARVVRVVRDGLITFSQTRTDPFLYI